MYVRFKDGVQDHYPVLENILLVEAPDDDTAHELSVARAKEDEGDHKDSFTWQDRPAAWVFVGIRKLISVSHRSLDDRIGSGDEVTYSQLDLPNREALDRLVAGEDVNLTYVE
jgi:hypothetical protein